MIIDVAYICLLAMAVFKGISKGFVIAVFSFFAVIIGIAAAMKLSVAVASWLGANTGIGAMLLPVLAFTLVMVCVTLLVRICALLIQKTLQLAMLGFINRAAGVLLYAILYTILFSVILFFIQKINLIKPETIAASRFYSFIQPWGPRAVDSFAMVLPVFKNMFQQLEQFFGNIAKKAAV